MCKLNKNRLIKLLNNDDDSRKLDVTFLGCVVIDYIWMFSSFKKKDQIHLRLLLFHPFDGNFHIINKLSCKHFAESA